MAMENPNGEYLVTTFNKGGGFFIGPDTGVRILHIPTGIQVECDSERSVHANKAIAMDLIRAKVARHKADDGFVASVQTAHNMRLFVINGDGDTGIFPHKFQTALEAAEAADKAMQAAEGEIVNFVVSRYKKI